MSKRVIIERHEIDEDGLVLCHFLQGRVTFPVTDDARNTWKVRIELQEIVVRDAEVKERIIRIGAYVMQGGERPDGFWTYLVATVQVEIPFCSGRGFLLTEDERFARLARINALYPP